MSTSPVEVPYLDPFDAFAPFAREPFALFLDSALRSERFGRYSFIAVDPYATLVSREGRIDFNGEAVEGDPFAVLEGALARHSFASVPGLPPFQGGVAGYFGFDLCHHLERLPHLAATEPNFPDMMIGFFDSVIAFDNLEGRAWIFSNGLPERETAAREARAKLRAETLGERLRGASKAPPDERLEAAGWAVPVWEPGGGRAAYETEVGRVIDYIRAGDIFQANLSRELRARLPGGLEPFTLYRRLRRLSPTDFSAFLGTGEVTLLSSSPERFLMLSGDRVETRPIKGTRPRGRTPEEDRRLARELQESAKDRAENVMIVDLLRNDLARVCRADSVEVSELCTLESFASVHHLTSTVVGSLKPDAAPIDLLRAAFPGGSITGCPKIRAMEIIAELEGKRRGPHFGGIGYIGFDGTMDLNIAIRTIAIKDGWMTLRVGGGIVADSDRGEEFDETESKVHALRRAAEPDG